MRSLGPAWAWDWLVPNEAAMIEAEEVAPGPAPPNRAAGLIAGDGLVASGGEGGGAAARGATVEALMGSSDFLDASGSVLVVGCEMAPPFLFFGPFARPLRTSARGAPSAGGSLAAAGTGLEDASMPAGLSDLEPLGEPPLAGGPRARIPARPGLNRAASLLFGAAATGG